MEITRQKLIFIIVGALVFGILAIYLFLYNPLIRKLKVAGLACQIIETEAFQARESIVALEAVEKKNILITEDEVSLAIDELTKQGKLKGINFISMTPKKTKEVDDIRCKILPIEMEIESTYEALGVFLGLLDELEHSLVTVNNFNITSDPEKAAKLNVRLVVNMYLLDN